MKQVRFVKVEDKVELPPRKSDSQHFDLQPFLGTWVNTNKSSRGMAKVVLTARGAGLFVRVFGVCEPSPCDWGEVEADGVYGNSIGAGQGSAFTASYSFDFISARLLANLSLGLLIVACFSSFNDDSGRANYFSREFFRRVG